LGDPHFQADCGSRQIELAFARYNRRAAMTWGEAQSVIQLAAALNAIYLGLRDIRNPYVRREQEAVAEQVFAWKRTPDAQLGMTINNNQANLTTILDNFDRIDKYIGAACAVFVVIYVVILIVSAFQYGHSMSIAWAILISVVGFVPIFVGFVLNIKLVCDLNRSIAPARQAIERQLIELRNRVDTGISEARSAESAAPAAADAGTKV
jgi:hypothetical protein